MKTQNLSVRLLRRECGIEEAIRADSGLKEYHAEDGFRLFVVHTVPVSPGWLEFVTEFTSAPLDQLSNRSCGAVLFVTFTVPVAERAGEDKKKKSDTSYVCAVSFGTAHHGLNPEAFERSFGLRVVLNAVSRSNLRGLDIATLDATTVQRRVQTSRNADLRTFGMDTDRDLLRLAAGVPSDRGFATSLAGKDALTIHTRLEPSQLSSYCAHAVELYMQKNYQRDFRFIDHIVPVRDRHLVATLDDMVFDELSSLVNGKPSDLHLSLPDVLNPDDAYDVAYFGAGLKPGSKQAFSELDIADYVAELRNGKFSSLDMVTLKTSHEVRAIVNGQADRAHKQRVYNCFVLEAEKDNHVFVLFDGSWFQVDREFHTSVETDFAKMVAKKSFVASTTARTERDFIVALNSDIDLLNLDQVKLSPAGANGANLEPCDFLSRRKQFIHLKDGHDSAPISHLWNQGLVSAESFVRDADFRARLRKAVQTRQRQSKKSGFEKILPDQRHRPDPTEYTVVFGIMRTPYSRSKILGLPFFSKVSFRAVAARIDSMGFPVEVHLIEKVRAGR